MFGGEEPFGGASLSREALASYLALLKSLYLLVEIPGWVPSRDRPNAFPPSQSATLPIRPSPQPSWAWDLKRSCTTGRLSARCSRTCASAISCIRQALPDIGFEPIRYYRDDSGLEADAIIELADGRWAAFEVKGQRGGRARCGLEPQAAPREALRQPEGARVGTRVMAVITGLSHYAREVDEAFTPFPFAPLRPEGMPTSAE